MRRVLRWELVRTRRARLAPADKPAVIVRGEDEFIVAVLDFVQVEGCLVSDRVGVSLWGILTEGETKEGEPVYLGLGRIENWRLKLET